jgi:methionyl-tRNA formyltransferase
MKRTSETITFFGSGTVAAESLKLLAQDFDIEAVVTKPKPAHHKGSFPVIEIAETLGLKTLFTANKKELRELFTDKPVQSRLGIVIDYGILIPQAVIEYFPLGIANSHFSLLPRWRGPDPISFAILNGDAETGVSVMMIVEQLDEGPLLAQQPLKIASDDTTPSLTDKLIALSHQLLCVALPAYIESSINPRPQSGEASYSRKLTKQDAELDWSKPAAQLERELRAFAGWPRSRTRLGKTNLVVTKAHVIDGQGEPGHIFNQDKRLGVYTSDGVLIIDALIPAGKKEMSAQAFLAGYQIN